jgi:TonB family protein
VGLGLEYDEPPEPTSREKPQYPQEAFIKKITGTVVVLFIVDDTGHVSGAEVLESQAGLDEEALACVSKWEFRPASRKGATVGTLAAAPLHFRIY